MSPSVKRTRCPNGYRKHPKTKVCTPVNPTSPRKRSPRGTRKKKGVSASPQKTGEKKLFRIHLVETVTNKVLTPTDFEFHEYSSLANEIAEWVKIDDVNIGQDPEGDLRHYFIVYYPDAGSTQAVLKKRCTYMLNKPFVVSYRDYEYDVLVDVTVTIQKV